MKTLENLCSPRASWTMSRAEKKTPVGSLCAYRASAVFLALGITRGVVGTPQSVFIIGGRLCFAQDAAVAFLHELTKITSP
jgi:hypothetical protein